MRTAGVGATLPLAGVSSNDLNPPGEAIRGPSRSSTVLDPEPTAQTNPKEPLVGIGLNA
jgi:hypothetical protein